MTADAEPCPAKSRSRLTKKLGEYAAIAAAMAGLIVGVDTVYSKVRQSQITRDALVAIHQIIDRRPTDQVAAFSLEVGGKLFAKDPEDEAISAAVHEANSHNAGSAFVILRRRENEFMQAATEPGGWALEYRAPYMEKPREPLVIFRCQNPVNIDAVIKSMIQYRRENNSWTSACPWERVRI